MTFHKCPEWGETNYSEDILATRRFDCGFIGDGRRRMDRCNADKAHRDRGSIPAEVARYRLALLDAAQAAETVASDMEADGGGSAYSNRCRELAQQMRAFAGHTASGRNSHEVGDTGRALARFLPKIWSR